MERLLKDVGYKITYDVCFNGWNITQEELLSRINNLTVDDIKFNKHNYIKFNKYNEVVTLFIWKNIYNEIRIEVEDIF